MVVLYASCSRAAASSYLPVRQPHRELPRPRPHAGRRGCCLLCSTASSPLLSVSLDASSSGLVPMRRGCFLLRAHGALFLSVSLAASPSGLVSMEEEAGCCLLRPRAAVLRGCHLRVGEVGQQVLSHSLDLTRDGLVSFFLRAEMVLSLDRKSVV